MADQSSYLQSMDDKSSNINQEEKVIVDNAQTSKSNTKNENAANKDKYDDSSFQASAPFGRCTTDASTSIENNLVEKELSDADNTRQK